MLQAKLEKQLAEKSLLENGPIGVISFADVQDRLLPSPLAICAVLAEAWLC
jgi:hypothetical protein